MMNTGRIDGDLIAGQFGEGRIHFVGKRLVSVFVETELVYKRRFQKETGERRS
jgi:hypothetical protein